MSLTLNIDLCKIDDRFHLAVSASLLRPNKAEFLQRLASASENI